jgi:hypothetical protein
VLPWFEGRKEEIGRRPPLRDQAFGESLHPDKLERLGGYEVHLDRKRADAVDAISAQGVTPGQRRRIIRFAKRATAARAFSSDKVGTRFAPGFVSSHSVQCR